jgi:hypothetical protein
MQIPSDSCADSQRQSAILAVMQIAAQLFPKLPLVCSYFVPVRVLLFIGTTNEHADLGHRFFDSVDVSLRAGEDASALP